MSFSGNIGDFSSKIAVKWRKNERKQRRNDRNKRELSHLTMGKQCLPAKGKGGKGHDAMYGNQFGNAAAGHSILETAKNATRSITFDLLEMTKRISAAVIVLRNSIESVFYLTSSNFPKFEMFRKSEKKCFSSTWSLINSENLFE